LRVDLHHKGAQGRHLRTSHILHQKGVSLDNEKIL